MIEATTTFLQKKKCTDDFSKWRKHELKRVGNNFFCFKKITMRTIFYEDDHHRALFESIIPGTNEEKERNLK